jgi:hypothetical protein
VNDLFVAFCQIVGMAAAAFITAWLAIRLAHAAHDHRKGKR